ncbi:AI-2E family transporter [Chitinophaga sedimenti]|uniref:AI-2E family transporter n=1 Tax=Chitinophaga sedimenti TaxID=2033606 RepID=UPI00200524B5|nr:AI-2E family transporter [Chitinophaga sedimenti]MCK7558631.1 AI-2E family transporter [Chitinophaga sedimenti]
MSTIDNERLKQVAFLIIIILLGALLFSELYTFFPGFLGAVTFYILGRNYMFRLVEVRNWPKPLAAALIMVLSFLIILLPVGTLINMVTDKIKYAVKHSDELMAQTQGVIQKIEEATGFKIISPERLQKAQEYLTGILPGFVGTAFNTLTIIAILYFILYFMLINARRMEESLYEYIPLKDENVVKLGKEVRNMVISNAVGIPLIAVLQGLTALLGYYIFGVPSPWFWFVITCFMAMVPVIGAAAAFIPISLFMFTVETWRGVGLLLYGLIIIGSSDNVFRLVVNKKIGDVHPMITIFGVLVGVSLFGFIGLIFGPLLISLFILLLEIYSNEYFTKKREVKIVRSGPNQKNKMLKTKEKDKEEE